jgi:hypothetical protein
VIDSAAATATKTSRSLVESVENSIDPVKKRFDEKKRKGERVRRFVQITTKSEEKSREGRMVERTGH